MQNNYQTTSQHNRTLKIHTILRLVLGFYLSFDAFLILYNWKTICDSSTPIRFNRTNYQLTVSYQNLAADE